MQFLDVEKKGISRYFLDADVEGEPLRVHISEVDAGESHPLRANEAVVFDPRKLHGLVNTSKAPVRYMVIIRPEEKV